MSIGLDFLESLTGMDWGVADEKDAPEKLRGLGVVYHLESTITGAVGDLSGRFEGEYAT